MSMDGTALSRIFTADDEEDMSAPPASFFEDVAEETDAAAEAEQLEPVAEEAPGDEWPAEAEGPSEDGEEAPPAEGQGEEPAAPEGEPEGGPSPEDLLAGRYQNVQALEQGYRSLQAEFSRREQVAAQERQAYEQRFSEQDQTIQAMMGILQPILAEQDPEAAAAIGQWQQQQEMERRIAEQVQQQVEPISQRTAQSEVKAAAREAVLSFYRNHPDVTPRGPEDRQVAISLGQLMQRGLPIDITNAEHIEAAYAASKDPQVMAELSYAPHLFGAPGSITTYLASRTPAVAPAAANGQPPTGGGAPARGPVRRRVEAQVESGGSGSPVEGAPGAKPKDPWGDDEFGEGVRAFLGRPRSVIFGSQR